MANYIREYEAANLVPTPRQCLLWGFIFLFLFFQKLNCVITAPQCTADVGHAGYAVEAIRDCVSFGLYYRFDFTTIKI